MSHPFERSVPDVLDAITIEDLEGKAFSREKTFPLTSLIFKDGKPVFTSDNLSLLYEVVCNCIKVGIQETVNAIQNLIDRSKRNPSSKQIIFSSSVYDDVKIVHDRQMDQLHNRVRVIEGIFTCPVPTCRSTKTTSFEIQMRSSDEPPELIITCMACGKVS